MLKVLPKTQPVEHEEVLGFVEARHFYGRGIGWMDVHLLASARLLHHQIWSRDQVLSEAAVDLGVAYRAT